MGCYICPDCGGCHCEDCNEWCPEAGPYSVTPETVEPGDPTQLVLSTLPDSTPLLRIGGQIAIAIDVDHPLAILPDAAIGEVRTQRGHHLLCLPDADLAALKPLADPGHFAASLVSGCWDLRLKDKESLTPRRLRPVNRALQPGPAADLFASIAKVWQEGGGVVEGGAVAAGPAETPDRAAGTSSAAEVPAAADDDHELPPCHDDQEHDWHPVEVAGRLSTRQRACRRCELHVAEPRDPGHPAASAQLRAERHDRLLHRFAAAWAAGVDLPPTGDIEPPPGALDPATLRWCGQILSTVLDLEALRGMWTAPAPSRAQSGAAQDPAASAAAPSGATAAPGTLFQAGEYHFRPPGGAMLEGSAAEREAVLYARRALHTLVHEMQDAWRSGDRAMREAWGGKLWHLLELLVVLTRACPFCGRDRHDGPCDIESRSAAPAAAASAAAPPGATAALRSAILLDVAAYVGRLGALQVAADLARLAVAEIAGLPPANAEALRVLGDAMAVLSCGNAPARGGHPRMVKLTAELFAARWNAATAPSHSLAADPAASAPPADAATVASPADASLSRVRPLAQGAAHQDSMVEEVGADAQPPTTAASPAEEPGLMTKEETR